MPCCGAVKNACTNAVGIYTCTCSIGYRKVNAGTLWETCKGKKSWSVEYSERELFFIQSSEENISNFCYPIL